MLTWTIMLLAGLALLTAGAELLVRGASRLAAALGISPLIIGLTVVAFGTSSPELAVSVKAALAGQADIALGNVVGSNIFNVLGILGLSALAVPLVVSRQLLKLDLPLMIAVSLLLPVLSLDGRIGRGEGAALLLGLILYILVLLRLAQRQKLARTVEVPTTPATAPRFRCEFGHAIMCLVGLAALALGARWLVTGASEIARMLGIGELLIGLTIVAVGTSLPELVTSFVAGLHGERDIAVGNIVGSNLFNLLGVLGAAAMIGHNGVAVSAAALHFDIPVMVAAAVACLPIFLTGREISRAEGAVLSGYYLAYVAYLVLAASAHPALPVFRTAMIYGAFPLTALAGIIGIVRTATKRNHAGPASPDCSPSPTDTSAAAESDNS